MQEFLATLTAFPTIVFSAALAVVLLYWAVVIAGALDLEFLDSALGLEAADGAFDGAVESLDGAADGALEGLEAADPESADSSSGGLLAGLLNAMGVRGIPITVVASLIVFWAWLFSYLGVRTLGALLPGLLMGLVIAVIAFSGGVLLASLSTRPMRKIFVTHQAPRRASLIGNMCTILSGKVDEHYGRAEIEDGGAGFVAEVRAPGGTELHRGDQAVVYGYEPQEGIFFIGPVDRAISDTANLAEPS